VPGVRCRERQSVSGIGCQVSGTQGKGLSGKLVEGHISGRGRSGTGFVLANECRQVAAFVIHQRAATSCARETAEPKTNFKVPLSFSPLTVS